MVQRLLIIMPMAVLSLAIFITAESGAEIRREDIGELKIHDVLLRPQFILKEPQEGTFKMGESSFALRWELEETFKGVIRVGSRELMNASARYTPSLNEDVTLVEAYGEYNSPYGRFRMGRIPTEFGVEGKMWERELIFPRAMLFRERVVALRDIGASYYVSYNDFYTGVVVHNGESDTDLDGRMWYTGQWGYQFPDLDLGFAGETGSTTPASASTSADTLASVDVSKNAKWRVGGLYLDWTPRNWRVLLEAYGGEREQNENVRRFTTGHFDLIHNFSNTFSMGVRYDLFDPDLKISTNLIQEASLALTLSNKTQSSNLILVGTQVFEESNEVPNNEIRLIWSLSPSGVVQFRSSSNPNF